MLQKLENVFQKGHFTEELQVFANFRNFLQVVQHLFHFTCASGLTLIARKPCSEAVCCWTLSIVAYVVLYNALYHLLLLI